MSSPSVTIQIAPEAKPAIPSWMGEVAAFARVLTHTGTLQTIQAHVRFARARFGHYELVDFVVVLIGYILSGEPTLLAFYERLAPWAESFMALGWRVTVCLIARPSRVFSPLSISRQWKSYARSFRRTCWHANRLLPPLGLFDRAGTNWLVIDVDGTRQAARQRALPQTDALP